MAASSDNPLSTIDPFLRHSDYFWPTPFDNDSLTKFLYDDHDFHTLLQPQPDLEPNQLKPTTTPSTEPDASTTPNRTVVAVNGKSRITKRKSRATKKNQTTFITADPANFRQMVQHVTGIRFDSSSSLPGHSLSHFLKPEIRRPVGVGRFYTSSYLLDQSQGLIGDRSIYGAGGLNSVGTGAQSVIGGGGDGGYGASDGYACFPTLESWKVM